MRENITCILCPMGCALNVEMENGVVRSVSGNGCKRGEKYAREECTAPTRMLTALVRLENRDAVLSVKTARPIPKKLILPCAGILRQLKLRAPINIGKVVLPNIMDTGVDVIATKSVL